MKKIIISLLSIILLTVSVYAQEENNLQNEKAKEILNKLSEKSESYSDITAEFSYNFFNFLELLDLFDIFRYQSLHLLLSISNLTKLIK